MKDIFKQIRDERQDFLQNEIEVVPGYNFSQYNTLKKVHLYFTNNYEKGNYEEIGGILRKKVFHNLSTWRCEVATKMIDMDVKDFILVSNNADTDWNVYILEKELKVWLKKNEMGLILNEISRLLPIYGSVVLQKTKKGAEVVDLRYFYVDQSAKTLNDASYINKRMLLSHRDMRKMGKYGWENVDEAIDKFSGKYTQGYDLGGVNQGTTSNLYWEGSSVQKSQAQAVPLVEVWERYGEVPLSWFTDKESDDNEYVMAKYCVAGVDQTAKNENGVIMAEEGLVLYKEQIDEIPFKEVHYNKIEGRWLGIGIVEALFESQRRINEVKNQEARANELASIQLFQTLDETIAGNITTDLNNGDILKVKSLIQPIATESRNNTGFTQTAQDIEEHANNQTFSRDVVSGENSPASATLGAVQIQTQQTTAVFDYKKENIGLFLGSFIKDLVFPQIEKELNREHTFRLTGSFSELAKLRNNYATRYANNRIIEAVLKGADVTPELQQGFTELALKDIATMGEKIWTDVQKDFFRNLDYEVDIVSTGENRNIYAQINNGNAILQALAADPTILQDPAKKKVLFKVMSAMGWHTSELEDIDNSPPMPMQPEMMEEARPSEMKQLPDPYASQ
jgi:hypothetical protein